MSIASVGLSPVLEEYLNSHSHFLDQCDLWSRESILIFLAMSDSVVPIRVLESDSIASVKLRIQTSKGIFMKKQKLVFDGKELARNTSRVSDYGVTDGKILHLVLRLSDLQTITVCTVSGKEFELQVDRKRNIGYVKQKIASLDNNFHNLKDQKLTCNGEELEDQRLINDICGTDDAVIHFLIQKSVQLKANKPCAEVTMAASQNKGVLMEPVIVNPSIKLTEVVKHLIETTINGLEKGRKPIRSTEGSGGAYFMQDSSGKKYISVFKPIDEEPMALNNPTGLPVSTNGEGLKKGTRVGEGAFREVAAYILDHDGFSGVPPTVMVKCLHESFNHSKDFAYCLENFKIGSLQMFIKNYGSCEEMGSSVFPVEEVHKISVLDIRLANVDRHAGNILVSKDGDGKFGLVPIDHGYCLPETFEDCTFEWLYWPQAQEPYSKPTIDYINSLNAEQDLELLKFHGWEVSLACTRTLRISTMLLKKGARRGLPPYTIGSIMCRKTMKDESVIEQIVREAEDGMLPGSSEDAFIESVSLIMDHRLDELCS